MESSSSRSEQEFDPDYKQINYDSLINDIKEVKIFFKIWMEKIAAPLNIIANYIMKNQIPKLEAPIIENNA